MNEWSWVLSHVIAFKTYVSASMTSLAIFLEIVSVSAPSFCRLFHFQPQLTQKLFLQITYTPLPSVHFLYTYYINTLKKSSQTKPALWRFFFFFSEDFWKWTSCWEMRLVVVVEGLVVACHSSAGYRVSTPFEVCCAVSFSPSYTFLHLSFVHGILDLWATLSIEDL